MQNITLPNFENNKKNSLCNISEQYNLNSSANSTPNLPEYLYYGQFDRTEELDQRIIERNFSDQPLQPYYDIRSITTRQQTLPIVLKRQNTDPKVSLNTYSEYDPNKVFSPISKNGGGGPFNTFSKNINIETSLKNQYCKLEYGGSQNLYVPSSTSDLYVNNVPISNKNSPQPFPNLFNNNFSSTKPINSNINSSIPSKSQLSNYYGSCNYQTTMNHTLINSVGKNPFFNLTQQQMKNINNR
jgi:hypothetical protein